MAWPNFSVTTAYATLISGINTAFQTVGKLFKDQTTGDYVDQIRYNSSTDRFEYWTGSAWAELPMAGTAAGTAATLATARTIGGVSFNGSANINLPGVNQAGNQNTSGSSGSCTGNAATATKLATARTIGGVSFDGSANINLPGVNTAGNQNTSGSSASCTGNAATATALSTASGSAPSYACRAWVNFNGTGTVAIRSSGNVSSITDYGGGDYGVNFATAMPDTNYSVGGFCKERDDTNTSTVFLTGARQTVANTFTTTQARVCTTATSGTLYDSAHVSIQIHR